MSQHIAALESDLGAVLLQRRPVSPTGVGVRLLEHAGPLLLRLDAARADISRLTAAPATRIVIGVSPPAMTAQVTKTLAGMRQTQSLWKVTVRVLGREAITRNVATAVLVLGLVERTGCRVRGEQTGHARGDLDDADHPALVLKAGSNGAGDLVHARRSVGGQVQVLAGWVRLTSS